ncbi:hypothetical protein HMPREF9136_0334 [Prevotella dentalis DSM 3688]|uniref:Uncharacterized protein n=1 Tax=Prevotella dentalis (strain ATCC 49559 / DSM 3688 / JCM 13448 / NCTC 12043 / ES 2772) TaxID=908937 RepID=F9D0F6_PREDD|nr:hypothetical protein HMPREF9136_0334 [Prevotella dentalis DSM 3688]
MQNSKFKIWLRGEAAIKIGTDGSLYCSIMKPIAEYRAAKF